jgi:transcriptional regulator with XRE-family HTH domain
MPKQKLSSQTLPSSVALALQRFGRNIARARKRRGLKQVELAQRVGVSKVTLQSVERGAPTTGIGTYFACAWVLGLLEELSNPLAPERDEEGKAFEARLAPKRVRGQAGALNDEF